MMEEREEVVYYGQYVSDWCHVTTGIALHIALQQSKGLAEVLK